MKKFILAAITTQALLLAVPTTANAVVDVRPVIQPNVEPKVDLFLLPTFAATPTVNLASGK